MTGFHDILEKLGFYKEEVAVYEILLQKGSLTASQIQEFLPSVKKGLLYKTLNRLIVKKVIQEDDRREGVALFAPLPPDVIIDMMTEHEKSVREARVLLDHLAPSLRSQYIQATHRPLVRLYNGKEELREVYEDVLISNVHEIFIVRPLHRSISTHSYFGKWFDEYQKRRIRKGVLVRALTPDSAKANHDTGKDSKNLYERTWMNPNDYTSNSEIRVYENKIVFISYGKELFAMIVEHEEFAHALKDIYELARCGALSKNIKHDHI